MKHPLHYIHASAVGIHRISFLSTTLAFVALYAAAPPLHAAAIAWSVASGGNGHFYELITASVDWNAALADAATRTNLGVHGYLVTITSAAENQFLLSTFDSQTDSYAWIGGTDRTVEDQWL